MAYNGYLLKLNGYTVPEKMIQYDSFNVLLSTTDLDSYRDADGYLHRNALSHKVAKVEFNTPILQSGDFETFMANVRSQYSNSTEKKILNCSVYIIETNSYVTCDMYLPDITPSILKKNSDGSFLYNPVRFAFIGY